MQPPGKENSVAPQGGDAKMPMLDLTDHSGASSPPSEAPKENMQNLIAFFLLGLFNNFPYVVFLAAAKEISEQSVGLVFIASILPSFMVKLTIPYWAHKVSYRIRVGCCACLMTASFLMVAFSKSVPFQLVGVGCASLQQALGEVSMIAYTSFYDGRTTVTCWSSGTGLAGPFGFLWNFVLMEALNLGLTWMMLITCVFPLCWLATFFFGLLHPVPRDREEQTPQGTEGRDSETPQGQAMVRQRSSFACHPPGEASAVRPVSSVASMTALQSETAERGETVTATVSESDSGSPASGGEKFRFFLSLWHYIVPLALVYFAEYTMQSGTWAAIGFPSVNNKEARKKFYFISNWLYQVGVLVSRSSGAFLPMSAWQQLKWPMPLAQCVLLVFFCWAAWTHPPVVYDWWLLSLTFVAGLFGGGVYVGVYTLISSDFQEGEKREFALTAAGVGDSLGVTLADFTGLFVQACVYKKWNVDGNLEFGCPII
uniref:Protein BTN n=1 Tax=Chromera velia CCMP2878 TaxID=1169474 RepID=A0A0G4FI13_9ALVE|eukprot:Cvel_3358.t1-p1 / transcript=Cvel_3358.t1 / gene=Cvel_3358 / organism=Chromera_velia_CCMP2878 / gene_product=Protein btn-1, putative / transcript_product=Protein btn-1, putative / location=Cvel_scaffold134:33111-37724(-) / protein_length=483 / sequence_SO=supercontig / SO=protein_coding / is_pseudo=false